MTGFMKAQDTEKVGEHLPLSGFPLSAMIVRAFRRPPEATLAGLRRQGRSQAAEALGHRPRATRLPQAIRISFS